MKAPATEGHLDGAQLNALWAATLIDALVAGGVKHVCISPGSRSTPLTWAFAEREGRGLTCSVHLDERGAGFFAVGYAAATGDAAALVCTSGTAAANYLPAVVEAHHSRLPLVVLTADRPPELRDRGAWQTIDQVKLYGSFVRWFHELGEASAAKAALRYVEAVGARAAATALGVPRGPVHLNVPLREPLGPVVGERGGERPDGGLRVAAGEPGVDGRAVTDLAARIAAEPRGLIVVGRPALAGEAARAVLRLAAVCAYPVLAEPLSGLRFGGHDGGHDGDVAAQGACLVGGYDAFLRPDAGVDIPPPHFVLRIGGSVTWKHVADYLGRADEAWQAAIDPELTWDDPTGRIALRVAAPVAAACAATADVIEANGARDRDAGAPWRAWWCAADAAVAGVRAAHAASPERGGTAWIYPALLDILPDGAVLYAANSMAVRDLDTFTAPTAKAILPLCNRGAAGIDGTLSSALGAAFAAGRPTALVTGDLAFLHDGGGFGAVADLVARYGDGALDLFIVIVDDGGGGIFEHLGVAAADRARFEAFFATPQRVDLVALCAAWGIPCRIATDVGALHAAAAVRAPVRVAVIPVDRAANTAAHRAYWREACAAVTAATAGIDAFGAPGAGS